MFTEKPNAVNNIALYYSRMVETFRDCGGHKHGFYSDKGFPVSAPSWEREGRKEGGLEGCNTRLKCKGSNSMSVFSL